MTKDAYYYYLQSLFIIGDQNFNFSNVIYDVSFNEIEFDMQLYNKNVSSV